MLNYIKEIELKNFQKHSHLKLEFVDGVNILYGESGIGKSCILRAIKWVYFNEPEGDCIKKEGTKETSVKIIRSDGLIIERIKSATKNAYILTMPNQEIKRYDSVGRDIPEEIKNILEIKPIRIENQDIIFNFADQITLPFLFGDTGIFRMKLFNLLTGNHIIDRIFQSLNKDILKLNRDEKQQQDVIIKRTEELSTLNTQIIDIKNKKESLENIYNIIKEKHDKYCILLDLKENLIKLQQELNNIDLKINFIKVIDRNRIIELKNKLENYAQLIKIQNERDKLLSLLNELENKIKTIKITSINFIELKEKVELLNKYEDINKKIKDFKREFDIIQNNIITINNIIKTTLEQKNKLLKEITDKFDETGICPVCQTKLKT